MDTKMDFWAVLLKNREMTSGPRMEMRKTRLDALRVTVSFTPEPLRTCSGYVPMYF